MVFSLGDFALEESFSNVRKHFFVSQLGVEGGLTLVGRVQGCC